MAKKALVEKANRKPKFGVRGYTRCNRCGRPRAVFRSFGLTEQSMFHEIDIDKVDRTRGMDITVVTTATNDDEGRALLRALGFPFKES